MSTQLPQKKSASLRAIKFGMKTSVRWVLFEYEERQPVILSKPFKTKKEAEKARLKLPPKRARKVGIGVLRNP
jgi:hypothetical protein